MYLAVVVERPRLKFSLKVKFDSCYIYQRVSAIICDCVVNTRRAANNKEAYDRSFDSYLISVVSKKTSKFLEAEKGLRASNFWSAAQDLHTDSLQNKSPAQHLPTLI